MLIIKDNVNDNENNNSHNSNSSKNNSNNCDINNIDFTKFGHHFFCTLNPPLVYLTIFKWAPLTKVHFAHNLYGHHFGIQSLLLLYKHWVIQIALFHLILSQVSEIKNPFD